MIRLEKLTKHYEHGGDVIPILSDLNFKVSDGERVAIIGKSGSGKSTLLNLLGLLDTPSSGSYFLDGQDMAGLDDSHLSDIRNRRIGIVFQKFHLLKNFDVLQNVLLPAEYRRDPVSKDEARQCARELLEEVGLGHRLSHLPHQLSGGERQRVAIARALMNEPGILLADEPTGNLDTKGAERVMNLFERLQEKRRVALIMITHDPEIAQSFPRRIALIDGKIHEQ